MLIDIEDSLQFRISIPSQDQEFSWQAAPSSNWDAKIDCTREATICKCITGQLCEVRFNRTTTKVQITNNAV